MSRTDKSRVENSIRPRLRVDRVARYMKNNPDKKYCLVRFDEIYDRNNTNIDHYLDHGWSICMGTEGDMTDDRSNTAPTSEGSRVATPITKNGGGTSPAQFVLMEIDADRLLKNGQERNQRSQDRFDASAKGRKVVHSNGETKITDSEANSQTKLQSDNE